jgi:hypothetical protein
VQKGVEMKFKAFSGEFLAFLYSLVKFNGKLQKPKKDKITLNSEPLSMKA